MALSPNQNQLRKHGNAVLNLRERFFHSTAERSMLLWDRVNIAAADFGEVQVRENYLRVRFEDLCNESLATTTRILDFLEAQVDPEPIARAEIAPPESLARWRNCSPRIISKLERAGAAGLRRFGYLE